MERHSKVQTQPKRFSWTVQT